MSKNEDKFLEEILEQLAGNLASEGLELIDAQTNQPVVQTELIFDKNGELIESTGYENDEVPIFHKLLANSFGKIETTDNEDGTFTHTLE